jgi:hypothetical protein
MGNGMENMNDKSQTAVTVSDKIINSFVKKLATEKGFEEVAARLQTTLFTGKISDATIRSALFEDDVS